jgi:hypothetical protein
MTQLRGNTLKINLRVLVTLSSRQTATTAHTEIADHQNLFISRPV